LIQNGFVIEGKFTSGSFDFHLNWTYYYFHVRESLDAQKFKFPELSIVIVSVDAVSRSSLPSLSQIFIFIISLIFVFIFD